MKTYIHTKTYTWMFKATVFVTAKKWKKPKCLSNNEWINKMWYLHRIHSIQCSSNHKKEWSANTRYIMDEPWKHYASVKETRHNKPHVIWLCLYETSKVGNSRDRKAVQWLSKAWGGGGGGNAGWLLKGTGLLGGRWKCSGIK